MALFYHVKFLIIYHRGTNNESSIRTHIVSGFGGMWNRIDSILPLSLYSWIKYLSENYDSK
jgi:hypothetical protein